MNTTKLKNIKVSIYETDIIRDRGAFFIEIQHNAMGVEVWLGHTQYGIKDFIFGSGEPLKDEKILMMLDQEIEELCDNYELNFFDSGYEEDFTYFMEGGEEL